MTQSSCLIEKTNDLGRANELMILALTLLDQHDHQAAAYLDHAIMKLGIRPNNQGMPPSPDYS